jgi:MFS family permease
VSIALDRGDRAAAAPASQTVPYPPAVLGWWALGVFTLALIVSYTDRQVLNLLVDPVRTDLRISDTQISLLQDAAFALFYATAGVPLGRLADVLPRRAVIISGVLAWSASTFACGLAASYGQLFLARLCVGVGEAALLPAALSILADYFPPSRRGTAIGVIIIGASVGSAVANIIGGLMFAAVRAGDFNWVPGIAGVSAWRAVFYLISAPGALIALLILTVREPARRAPTGLAQQASLKEAWGEFAARGAALVPIYGSLALMGISSFAMIAWVPALLSRKYGMTPGQIGPQLGLFCMVGGVIGSLGMGIIGDALTKRYGKAARLGAAAVVALPSALIILIMAGVSTFGAAGSMAVASASVQDVVSGRIRGVAASLVSLAGTMVGMGVAPTLVALLTDKVFHNPADLALSITTVGAPAALASALALWMSYNRIQSRPGLAADTDY